MTQIVPVKIIRETVKFFQGIEIILIGPAVIGSAIRPVPDRYLSCVLPFCLQRLGPSGSNLHFLLSIYHCSMTCISIPTPPHKTAAGFYASDRLFQYLHLNRF